MNRLDFQKWLDNFPEDTEIEVMVQAPDTSWSISDSSSQLFDVDNENHFEYFDFTGNQFVKVGSKHYDKRFLTLGGRE